MNNSLDNCKLALLSDPFLQFPTETSIRVVWFTEFVGKEHRVIYGENLEKLAFATTTKLSRVREDEYSNVTTPYQQITYRNIWRHEAEIKELIPEKRIPYQVISIHEDREIKSNIFTLTPKPQPETPVKILLTSDHQLMPMVATNLQKVIETIGQVDAIFHAGDLVNIADCASQWFDDSQGGAFFPCLQGNANYILEKEEIITVYYGGELIQHSPIFPTIGNHEVMGRFSSENSLDDQFSDAVPRLQAENQYQAIAQTINPTGDDNFRETWIKNHSFNTDTYEEIFTLPENSAGNKRYYSLSFGNIYLIVLYVTNIWRYPHLDFTSKGRYQEAEKDLNNPQNWSYGQHIFEPICQESPQYQWLEKELENKAFKQAAYKVVMFHHPPHTLGGNIVPPYTNPIPKIDYKADGSLQAIRYQYPMEKDYIIRDLMPLLESAGINLVFYGHSHLWNRFKSSSGINFLESSNVGNSYGAYLGKNKRPIPTDYSPLNYAEIGNPNGLEPIIPNLAPLVDENNQPLPYIASNDITVFSILDTHKGSVSSYRFDTRNPHSEVIKFDEFFL